MSELADSNISLVNGVFVKQMRFRKAGWIARTHAHNYDHQTLVASGRLMVTVDGIVSFYQAPSILVIEAGKQHLLEALDDETVAYCIHAVTGSDNLDDAESLVVGVPNAALHDLA